MLFRLPRGGLGPRKPLRRRAQGARRANAERAADAARQRQRADRGGQPLEGLDLHRHGRARRPEPVDHARGRPQVGRARRTPTSPSRRWSSSTATSAAIRSSARRPGSTSRPPTRTSRGCSSSSTSPASGEEIEPELTVIYTPNLKAEGYPDDRLIAVDLEQGVTRVFNSDYFGESKKGGLRMWNKLVYERGGLPLHAGCKVIPTEQRQARRPDRRPLGHRQDDDHLHAPERLAAGAGRLRRLDAERPRLRDRERLLREDLRPESRRRADDLRRGHAARLVPRERLAARRRGRLLRHVLHAERPRDLPVLGDRERGLATRSTRRTSS